MSVSLDGSDLQSVDLGIKNVLQYALFPFDENQWGLVVMARPQDIDITNRNDRDKRELYILVLDNAGQVHSKSDLTNLELFPDFSFHNGMYRLSVVSTPLGLALTFENDGSRETEGAYLLLLDNNFEFRKLMKINDTTFRGHGFQPKLNWNGEVLGIVWQQLDNDGYRLFVRQYDIDGNPITEAQIVSDSVRAMSNVHAVNNGFFVTWLGVSHFPRQVNMNFIPNGGFAEESRNIFQSQELPNPVQLGGDGSSIKALLYDRGDYPFKVLLKDLDN